MVSRIKSWKAPGPDGIYGFWWKAFRSASTALRGLIEGAINLTEEVPQWLVTGRTVLIPKTSPAPRADQYRPIACLNTMYKALTVVLEGIVRDHVMQNDILPVEQCALRSGRRGCLDALMVDTMVTEDATLRSRNLDVAWIDYRKAFDHVPHGWLSEALRVCKVPMLVQQCIKTLQSKWSTVFTIRSKAGLLEAGEVQYQRGIFQIESLSLLLF